MALPPIKMKSVVACDLIAGRLFTKKDLAPEKQLMKTCWWEYRGIHPVNRTELFSYEFQAATQRFYGKYRDHANADYVSGLGGKESSIFKGVEVDPTVAASLSDQRGKNDSPSPREKYLNRVKACRANLSGIWRARQTADELQISYPIYLWACFERASMNGWGRLPRPTQLYGDKMKVAALDEQAKEIERFIPDFTNPLLQVGSQAPFKADFDAFLFELGRLRTSHKELAYNRMAEQGYITPETAIAWAERARA